MTQMVGRPPLLRSGRLENPKPSAAERVAWNVRYQLGAERLGPTFLAQVAGISAERARHLYYGRRAATVSEIIALADALGIAPARFLEASHGEH